MGTEFYIVAVVFPVELSAYQVSMLSAACKLAKIALFIYLYN